MPPFRVIGEAGWANSLLGVLMNYKVEAFKGISEKTLKQYERELGFQLPNSLRIFLLEFGCIDLDVFSSTLSQA